jgi:16S rRNA (uracil1498-N3)-methyltransferase
MRISRIYLNTELTAGQTTTLDENASHYLARVLRVQLGQPVILFNGNGFDYHGHITRASKKEVDVEIQEQTSGVQDSDIHTHIGQVMSKGDRMDYMIQKATELGVNVITPLTSQYCEVKLNHERQEKRVQHWQQIAIHAGEQSGRATIPQVLPIQTIQDWLSTRNEQLRLTLHPRAAKKITSFDRPKDIALLVGPEGGLTDDEVSLAQSCAFETTLLGPRILRTETAPVAALSVIQLLWGDMAQ